MKTLKALILGSAIAGISLAAAVAADQEPNTLTAAEKAAGWSLLFDGKTPAGWRNFGKPTFPKEGWEIDGGWLTKKGGVRAGNLVTDKQFTDFEFSWEWRLAKGANNGVKYFVDESRGELGHEYQMLGDAGGKLSKSSTASFYAVLAPREHKPVKLAPEVNRSRIVVRGDDVQHWLNGELVLEYRCGSEEVMAGVADSKFKKVRDFGKKLTARIMLTDHGSECSFRNLKIRELPAE